MKVCSRISSARLLAAAIFATAFTIHSTSVADSGSGSSVADALLSTGVERYTRHDYDGARDAFVRAYELDPTQVGILFNLALAEIQSGHPLEGARHLRAYLASPLARPERFESIRSKWLPQAEARIGRVSIDAPAGSTVSVDGVVLGDAPFAGPIDVAVGEHDVRARLGSREDLLHVSTPAGAIVAVRFLSPAADAPPPPSVPPASGARPVATDERAPAPASGDSPAKVITVSVLVAGALAATGAAIAFGVGAVNAQNRAAGLRAGLSSSSACAPSQASIPPACSQLAAATSDQSHNYSLQIDFYATAGAIAAVGIATWLLWPRAQSHSAWSIRPALDGRSAGAIVMGAF